MILRVAFVLIILLPVTLDAQLYLDSEQVIDLIGINIKKAKLTASNSISSNSTIVAYSILYCQQESQIPEYKSRHYGVFCRIESKIERKSKISPRFRLGSSAYVDKLEGKW